ncbi:response regulator transcription factor [Haloplanus sp. GCM10025708]|uniref:response regulator transcription factor n=1 Tax=Haloferacaceae TaxID=1644056 RepID=UPI0036198DCB
MSERENRNSDRSNSEPPVQRPSRATVLLVDDDEDFRETLALWMADERWEIREAADGAEALEKLDGTVDILVLDRGMPTVSGPTVIERLDEQPFDGRVVVVSAFEPDADLNESMVADYLTKPIDRQGFLDVLERHAR